MHARPLLSSTCVSFSVHYHADISLYISASMLCAFYTLLFVDLHMPSVVCIANMCLSPVGCLQAHILECDTSSADICIHWSLMP